VRTLLKEVFRAQAAQGQGSQFLCSPCLNLWSSPCPSYKCKLGPFKMLH